MKNVFAKLCIILVILFSLLSLFASSYAATKEDVIGAINSTYYVAGEPFRLPDDIISKATRYLKKHPMTTEQYNKILACINKAVAFANEVGTTDITKLSKEEINRGLSIVLEATRAADVDINEVASRIDVESLSKPAENNNKQEEVSKPVNTDKNENVTDIKEDKPEKITTSGESQNISGESTEILQNDYKIDKNAEKNSRRECDFKYN